MDDVLVKIMRVRFAGLNDTLVFFCCCRFFLSQTLTFVQVFRMKAPKEFVNTLVRENSINSPKKCHFLTHVTLTY